MPSMLFVCVANSFRSQMAEAIAKSLRQPGWEIWSAGSHPSGAVHPLAQQLMQEVGLDLSGHRSKGLGEVPQRPWDYVVTMGCGDRCPAVAAATHLDWEIPDPAGRPLEEARRIRDDLARRIRQLMRADAGIDKTK
ncbi:MAG: arsenate reductase ArsC [Candidatus Omnitrophica bacterium]|nr:arsenate reductase ArsC [Candidatus Omnitrophota bacterium]